MATIEACRALGKPEAAQVQRGNSHFSSRGVETQTQRQHRGDKHKTEKQRERHLMFCGCGDGIPSTEIALRVLSEYTWNRIKVLGRSFQGDRDIDATVAEIQEAGQAVNVNVGASGAAALRAVLHGLPPPGKAQCVSIRCKSARNSDDSEFDITLAISVFPFTRCGHYHYGITIGDESEIRLCSKSALTTVLRPTLKFLANRYSATC